MNRKHRTFFLTLYAAGLRVSEAAALQTADIESRRMQLRITRGKGNKTRLVPLSLRLLEALGADWLDSTAELILDGVPHYQVVFTLPKELSRLALGNRRAIYNLLFASACSALRQAIEQEHGFDAAAVMVLHTWNQRLESDVHVHAVVPGGGPALDGRTWRWAYRQGDPSSVGRYLVDADSLRQRYREAFLAGLDRLHAAGQLKLEGQLAELRDMGVWRALVERLEAATWVSYIEPPPAGETRPEQVLKYLARYLTGGPISDHRLVSADGSTVTLLAREGTTPGGERKQVPVTVELVEFVRRWSLHILPKGFTKARRYGGWSNTRRSDYVERCSILLEAAGAPLSQCADAFDPWQWPVSEDADPTGTCEACPRCGASMIPQGETLKPSWRSIFASGDGPAWYEP